MMCLCVDIYLSMLCLYFGAGGTDSHATHCFRRDFSNAGTRLSRRAALFGSWGSFVSQLLQVIVFILTTVKKKSY